MATLVVMLILVLVFMFRTEQNRQDIARRLSKVYTSGGRRLSSLFSSDRRLSIPEVLNHYTANDELKSYISLPVIYDSIEDKQQADKQKLNNDNLTSTNSRLNES